jgi:hypothetical protein
MQVVSSWQRIREIEGVRDGDNDSNAYGEFGCGRQDGEINDVEDGDGDVDGVGDDEATARRRCRYVKAMASGRARVVWTTRRGWEGRVVVRQRGSWWWSSTPNP